MKFGFIVYPQMQLMDLVGPVEVLNIWQKIDPDVEIIYIAENLLPIDCGNGISLKANYVFADAPQLDYMCVPGGNGRLNEMDNLKLLGFIQQQYLGAKLVIAICTGVFLLYNAGVLTNHKVTTYWRALPELADKKDITISEKRVVKSGKVWTSGGISSGVDLMFELINEIAGSDVAGKVQLLFEYFPSQKAYSMLDDIGDLPNYSSKKIGEASRLPEYIDKYIKNSNKT